MERCTNGVAARHRSQLLDVGMAIYTMQRQFFCYTSTDSECKFTHLVREYKRKPKEKADQLKAKFIKPREELELVAEVCSSLKVKFDAELLTTEVCSLCI